MRRVHTSKGAVQLVLMMLLFAVASMALLGSLQASTELLTRPATRRLMQPVDGSYDSADHHEAPSPSLPEAILREQARQSETEGPSQNIPGICRGLHRFPFVGLLEVQAGAVTTIA